MMLLVVENSPTDKQMQTNLKWNAFRILRRIKSDDFEYIKNILQKQDDIMELEGKTFGIIYIDGNYRYYRRLGVLWL